MEIPAAEMPARMAPNATVRPRTKSQSIRRRGRVSSRVRDARTGSRRAAGVEANGQFSGASKEHAKVQSEVLDFPRILKLAVTGIRRWSCLDRPLFSPLKPV